MMKAKSLLSEGLNIEVKRADMNIKRVFKFAQFYGTLDNYTICFLPVEYTEREIKNNNRYEHYLIEGALYISSLTSSYAKLVDIGVVRKRNYISEQLQLF